MTKGPYETLADRIRIAFASVPQPDANTVVMQTRDDEGTASCFSGKQVHSIPPESFVSHCTALWFFTDDALVYYLPGFMMASLEGIDKFGVIWGHIYEQFVGKRRPSLESQMNDEQRACVIEYCRSCGAESEDITSLVHGFKKY